MFFVGVVGMSIDDFYNLSLLEMTAKRIGYFERVEMEHFAPTRIVATLIHNAHAKHGKTPQQLMPLNLDRKATRNKIRYMDEHAEELAAWANKWPNRQIGKA